MEQHTVVLEREGPLGPHVLEAGDPPRERGVAVTADEHARRAQPPRRVIVGYHSRTGAESGATGVTQVDELEQPMRRVADLRRRQA